jgi:hypothetical protein
MLIGAMIVSLFILAAFAAGRYDGRGKYPPPKVIICESRKACAKVQDMVVSTYRLTDDNFWYCFANDEGILQGGTCIENLVYAGE